MTEEIINIRIEKRSINISTDVGDRKIFYVDPGNLTPAEAEKYLKIIMEKFTEENGEVYEIKKIKN